MSAAPERRRRVLFIGQLAGGVLGAVMLVTVMALGSNARTVVLLSAAIVALLMWGLVKLERAKFDHDQVVVSDGDWARELREVRDSRRIIVSAFEIERRRIERDLHDGAQQYLVAAAMKLGEAGLLLEDDEEGTQDHRSTSVQSLVEGAHRDAEEALRTLRATVSGIHPHVLSDLGLQAAVAEMVEHSGLDITLRCPHRLPDMPEEVAAVAWFFCSEALTNIAKHAPGARSTLLLAADQDLHASVVDNGPGGAHLRQGRGLIGMRERLAAFGGALELSSPGGGPTTVSARIPLLLAPPIERETT